MPDIPESRYPRPVKRPPPSGAQDGPPLGAESLRPPSEQQVPRPPVSPQSAPAAARSAAPARPRAALKSKRAAASASEWLERMLRLSWESPSERLALALGLGLALGWLGQFGTTFFDRHPALGILLALVNSALALLLARDGRLWQMPREALWAIAGGVLAGTLFLVGTKWGYSRTMGGFEGYALPRHPVAYGSDARDVTLTTSDRVALKATYLGRAKGERSAGKAILILPGWLSTRHSFSTATLAQWFHPEYDVLVLDPRGQGESGGAQHPNGSARFDILAGVAFLKAQGNEAVGVLAEREGAYAAVLAAGEGSAQGGSRLLDSLILVSPVAQWGEPSLGGGFWRDPTHPLGRITWRVAAGVRLKGGQGQPLGDLLPKLAGTPVMLSGPQDDPQGLVRQLYLVTPEPRSLRLYPGSDQPVAWKAYHRYYEAARQFFGMTLSRSQPPVEDLEGLPPELRKALQ